jgi:hypothetical protein
MPRQAKLAHAQELMTRVQAHYAKLKMDPPANIDIQSAWLLFNTRNDRMLYSALMRLGSRTDLTAAQRETVQDIWANWSVRRGEHRDGQRECGARGGYSGCRIAGLPGQRDGAEGGGRRISAGWDGRRSRWRSIRRWSFRTLRRGIFKGR